MEKYQGILPLAILPSKGEKKKKENGKETLVICCLIILVAWCHAKGSVSTLLRSYNNILSCD